MHDPAVGWRGFEVALLAATIPAFYWSLLSNLRWLAMALYLVAGTASLFVWKHVDRDDPERPFGSARFIGPLLIGGLFLSALLPAGDDADVVVVRLGTSVLALLRTGESLRPWFWRGELARYIALAIGVFSLCGAGFWWLEPNVDGFGEGLWLAFTTAATVGYGDIVPSTPASKIFAVFVVLLGFAVLSLVTAAIAAMWVQSEERKIEKELLRDLHAQLRVIRDELEQRRGRRPPGRRVRPKDAPPAASASAFDLGASPAPKSSRRTGR